VVALAKKEPGKLTVGTPPSPTLNYFGAVQFKGMTGTDVTIVTHKGTGPLTTDLLGGHVMLAFNTLPPAIGNIKAGIRDAFGLQKTGKRILAHVRSGLKHLSRKASVSREGEFWSVTGRDLEAVRNRRNGALPLRRAAMIASAEYQVAISTIISEAVEISRDDLVVETARLFGFDRTGPDLKEAIDRQVATLVKAGRLYLDGEVLRLVATSTVQ
jgi:Tripartite tricarboxylate transporter family receptor